MADQEFDDPGQEIMAKFIEEIKRRLTGEEAAKLKAADLELIRKLLADNSLTIASVRRGKFGDFAKGVAEEFPFPTEGGDAPSTVQ